MLRLVPLVTLLVVVWAGAPTDAATINAASCSYADVNTAVNGPGAPGPASDGDTVVVPSGSCTWTTTLGVTNKSISLIGAGIGVTVITSGSGTTDGKLLNITTKATGHSPAGFFRLSGFTFDSGVINCGGSAANGIVHIQGVSKTIRFDHNRVIHNANCSGLITNGSVAGVIDHNTFDLAGLSHSIVPFHASWGGIGAYGDNSWATDSTLGTADVLYVEDNTFNDNDGLGVTCFATDHFQGSRTAFRFNVFTDCVIATHGTESSGRWRGFRHAEAYHNTFTWSGANFPSVVGFRGGTGFIFNNTATGNLTRVFDMNTMRRDGAATFGGFYTWFACGTRTLTSLTRSGSTATATVATSADNGAWPSGAKATIAGADQAEYNGTFTVTRVTDTTFTYTIAGTPASPATGTITARSPFDTNTETTGYRCLDQAGAGKGILFSGDGPNDIAPVASAANALEPIYIWGNTDDAVLSAGAPSGGADVITENRDYYNQSGAFTGATGIGVGARSARPASCTTGVAWWATDQGTWNASAPGADGTLDKCTSPNTWTNAWYTPYGYPHPLVGAADPSSSGSGRGPVGGIGRRRGR